MTTASVNVNTTEYVRVNAGLNPLTLQAHRDAVRIVFSDSKPSVSTGSFHLISGDSPPWPISSIDTNVWALATSVHSSLIVTETYSRDNARSFSSNFITEVSKGLIPGHEMVYVNAYATDIGTIEKLIWPFPSQYVFSDTPSTLYLSSTDATADQNVVIDWLDGDYLPMRSVVQLNGQTPVPFATDAGLRVNRAFVVGNTSVEGNVYIARENNHAAGVPVDTSMIVTAFEQRTQTRAMCLYTVPDGYTLFGLSGYFSSPKGRDNDFFWNIRNADPLNGLPSTNTNVVSIYQSTVEVDFRSTPVPSKTDAFFTSVATSGSANDRVSARIVGVLIDNEYL